ncbi:MAG TPA: DUF6542 domain-containing protein [Pseudonocardiaceae bacterium]|nr:DUF6542 domain-containing protein [Pseudonocardiaceae bacterium]
MTTTGDRQRDLDVDFDGAAWDERSAFGGARGWPWWGAVLLALGLSLVGAVVDMKLEKSLSSLFDGAYFIACVAAVVMVRRRNLFGPMVQSPLVLAVVVPLTVVVTSGLGSGGKSAKLLAVAEPLLKAFPLMAVTAGAVVVIGGIRYFVQRRPTDEDDIGVGPRPRKRDDREEREPRKRPTDRDRESARRSRPAEGRSGGQGRPAANRSVPPERRGDRANPRDRGSEGRSGDGRGRGESSRGRSSAPDRDRARGSSGRGNQERSQPPRRTPRDPERRQPPRRRNDDS